MIEFLSIVIRSAFGLGIVLFLLHLIYSRHSIHWRYLVANYGDGWREPRTEKWGHLVLNVKNLPPKSYNGVVKIGVHREGMSVRMMIPPESFFCEPLFIPFEDIKGLDQSWYINAETVELGLKKAPDVKLIMPRSQIDWIKRHSGKTLDMHAIPAPNSGNVMVWRNYYIVWPVLVFGTFMLMGISKLLS